MEQPFWQKLSPGFFHHRMPVGDSEQGFEVFIWRGMRPGPTLLLNGGTHGDEYEGPTLLAEMASTWRPEELSGTVIAIPVLNENAFFAGRRESPIDGKNLARVFPGQADGSPTEQLAYVFRDSFLRCADYYVDFHSAGAAYTIMPWVGYCLVEDAAILEKQRLMARCFDRFWCWGTPYLPGRTLSSAYEHGVPAIYIECQGQGDVAPSDLSSLHHGLQRLLIALELLPGKVPIQPHRIIRESNVQNEGHLQLDHPAPCDGLLMSIIGVGTELKEGQTIGVVQPLGPGEPQTVQAAHSGRAVFVRRQRSVRLGDALASIVPIP